MCLPRSRASCLRARDRLRVSGVCRSGAKPPRDQPARQGAVIRELARQRLKRGVFTSIVELQTAINRFIAEANGAPTPFVWTKSADAILAAVQRGRQALEAIH